GSGCSRTGRRSAPRRWPCSGRGCRPTTRCRRTGTSTWSGSSPPRSTGGRESWASAAGAGTRWSCCTPWGLWTGTGWAFRAAGRLGVGGARARRRGRSPYALYRGDLTRTTLPEGSQDIVLSISTIEHGVEVGQFLAEARRLLRPGGLLFVTTDYWEERLPTNGSVREFGLPWK